MTRVAFFYGLCLLAIILAADSGWMPRVGQYVHDLPYGDKVAHFVLFGVLALVANLALARRGSRPRFRAVVTGSILALVVATADEYSNRFLTLRDWSLGDLAANYLGVLCLGVLPMWKWHSDSLLSDGDDSAEGQSGLAFGADDSCGNQSAGRR